MHHEKNWTGEKWVKFLLTHWCQIKNFVQKFKNSKLVLKKWKFEKSEKYQFKLFDDLYKNVLICFKNVQIQNVWIKFAIFEQLSKICHSVQNRETAQQLHLQRSFEATKPWKLLLTFQFQFFLQTAQQRKSGISALKWLSKLSERIFRPLFNWPAATSCVRKLH